MGFAIFLVLNDKNIAIEIFEERLSSTKTIQMDLPHKVVAIKQEA